MDKADDVDKVYVEKVLPEKMKYNLATWKAIETELELLQNDKMQDLIFAYSTAVQKEAFCAGYKKGIRLIMDILED